MKKLFLLLTVFLSGMIIISCDELPGDPNDDPPASNMKYIQDVDLYAQGVTIFDFHMFDVENSKSYHISDYDTQNDVVDFIGYYSSADGLSISSPDNNQLAGLVNYSDHVTTELLSGANHTDFKFIGNSQTTFQNIENEDDIISAYNSASGSTRNKASNLNINDVFGFRTGEGNYGVILIKDLTGSQTDDSSIIIDVKVQTGLAV